LALMAAGCGSSSTTSSTSSAAGATGATQSASTSGVACGAFDPATAPDPDGLLKTLPTAAQASYAYDPSPVASTPWATFKGKKPPYKIGYIGEPYLGSGGWVGHVSAEFHKLASQYKKEGLVSSFQEFTPPDPATATPAQQIAAFQQMVRAHVDAILLLPLSDVAMTSVVDAAGKAGIPVIGVDTIIPGS
jgi:ABC-type sugar transport system substrate-binding protein